MAEFLGPIAGTKQGDDVARLSQSPDLEFAVNTLPSPATEHLDVKVSLKVDASGQVTHCAPRRKPEVPARFSDLACVQARQLKFETVLFGKNPFSGFGIEQKIRFSK